MKCLLKSRLVAALAALLIAVVAVVPFSPICVFRVNRRDAICASL